MHGMFTGNKYLPLPSGVMSLSFALMNALTPTSHSVGGPAAATDHLGLRPRAGELVALTQHSVQGRPLRLLPGAVVSQRAGFAHKQASDLTVIDRDVDAHGRGDMFSDICPVLQL
eukprot:1052666-Heterocapsa_arctica.AAC.1